MRMLEALALKELGLITGTKTNHYLLSMVTKLSPGHYASNERGALNKGKRERREKSE